MVSQNTMKIVKRKSSIIMIGMIMMLSSCYNAKLCIDKSIDFIVMDNTPPIIGIDSIAYFLCSYRYKYPFPMPKLKDTLRYTKSSNFKPPDKPNPFLKKVLFINDSTNKMDYLSFKHKNNSVLNDFGISIFNPVLIERSGKKYYHIECFLRSTTSELIYIYYFRFNKFNKMEQYNVVPFYF